LQVIFAFVVGGIISFRAMIIRKIKIFANLLNPKKKLNYEKQSDTNEK
jgi:hypothetical protein